MPDGYYAGDQPNPNLRAFVEQHLAEHPYDLATDDYDVPAFDQPIETTKATAIYNMHTYWSKKPHDAIRQYIRHYTQPGDLVLDPFCGSGGTALAALMEGRKAIAIDRSPAATFITKNYCTPVDVDALQAAFDELKRKVKPEIDWLYATRCDRCGGPATTAYTVYSQVFQCPRCLEKVPLFDCVEVQGRTAKGKPKKVRVCPHCYERGIEEEISTRSEKFGAVPVLVSYLCEDECKPARGERRHNDPDRRKREYFEKYDLGKIKEIQGKDIPHWHPPHRMMNVKSDTEPWGVKWRAGTSNFRTIADLFTKRNLWALATLREVIDDSFMRDPLLFALTGILLGFSRMCQWIPGTSYPFPMMRGTYYMPPVSKEQLVPHYYENRIKLIARAAIEISVKATCMVSTEDARNLSSIPSNSIDYVFTDPSYADKVQYGELNFVWEAWLGLDTRWHDDEIIVNEARGKTETDWADMISVAMAECYRVLKPGRWLSLCYHDTSEGTWSLVQDIMAEVGFLVDRSDSALFIDTQQKSYNQLTADKVTKRDLVINFRKPVPGEAAAALAITGEEDGLTFNEKVRQIIREYLEVHPGATKDRIYDEVVSRMVRAGRMEAHNFDELLGQSAHEVLEPGQNGGSSRWYLKESEWAVADAAESAKEDDAGRQIRGFIEKALKEHPEAEGVHYSDLFEHYVYSVRDKPRRPLAEWLLDYFYKTGDGTYRPPVTEEEERIKAEGRARGLSRRIKRHLAYLQQGVAVPDAERPTDSTLAGWIRHCKRAGMYEQGRLLYEHGGLDLDRLSEADIVDIEEDYQVCLRMLRRESAEKGSKTAKNMQRRVL